MTPVRQSVSLATSSATRRVLLRLGDHPIMNELRRWLGERGFCVDESSHSKPDLIILGLAQGLNCGGWGEIVSRFRVGHPGAPLLFIAENGSEELAVSVFRAGANDYLRLPLDYHALDQAISNLLPPAAAPASSPMRGISGGLRNVYQEITRLAPTNCNVMLSGETGTGKELVASLIHRISPRSQSQFVPINCAALPETLVESELFGYERGSFTGAVQAYPGKFKLADGGTLFLDEVGEMSAYTQAKLLRVLESRCVFRLGASRPVPVDFRLIAATNQELKDRVADGQFRRDLYYRLSVACVRIPPLRERLTDIPDLLRHFATVLCFSLRRPMAEFTQEATEALMGYDWPGNVRELRNVVETVLVRTTGNLIQRCDLPDEIRLQRSTGYRICNSECELAALKAALAATNWNKSAAAERLKWSRMTLYRKIAKYQLLNA